LIVLALAAPVVAQDGGDGGGGGDGGDGGTGTESVPAGFTWADMPHALFPVDRDPRNRFIDTVSGRPVTRYFRDLEALAVLLGAPDNKGAQAAPPVRVPPEAPPLPPFPDFSTNPPQAPEALEPEAQFGEASL
jgi:hypothetical protein